MKAPVRVAVTGAAGQIGYALLFRIASGEMLGNDQPVILQLLEIPPALPALEGVVMELEDCAFPLLHDVITTSDANEAFAGANFALLVGSRPRGPGMERKDLLEANGAIFTVQGKALSDNAAPDVKVLVVGNPANTNALIAMKNAPNLRPEQFSAMTRLDHNRAISQLANKTDSKTTDIAGVTIWGNHSATQVPDISNATVAGKPAMDLVDEAWVTSDFIPTVQKRGAAIIDARGASSAASAANAAIDHMRNWALGTEGDSWVSMAIYTEAGHYGVGGGVMYSYPVRVSDGVVTVVEGLTVTDSNRVLMEATETELNEEKAAIASLLN